MREAYISVVGHEHSSLSTDRTTDGFHVRVQARQADHKGRGIFAMEPIKKGQKVWSTSMTARFTSGNDYRAFLAEIPADLACDVIQWAYVQSLPSIDEDTERAFISVDLDEGSFVNSCGDEGGSDDDEDTEANLGCHQEAAQHEEGGCKLNYFATRDIEVGEEILLDYSDFAISHGWEWFGL